MAPPFDPRALEAERVGFFGGSFDPPHVGHLFVASQAARAAGLEHVVWVPARRSPHKRGRPTGGALRSELVELMLKDAGLLGCSSVWPGELERPEPSYTVDSLEELARARGQRGGIYLVLGADQLWGIERWQAPERVFELAEPVVLARSGAEREELATDLAARVARGELDRALAGRLIGALVDPGRVDVAATDLRALLGAGEAGAAGLELGESLTPAVRARIDELGLYR